jgi:hypothetical protein
MTYMWYTGWTGRTCDETQCVLSLECVLSLDMHVSRKEAKAQRARAHVCGGGYMYATLSYLMSLFQSIIRHLRHIRQFI